MTEDELNQKTAELEQKMLNASRIYSARFWQTPEGKWLGYFAVNGDDIPCHLVPDEDHEGMLNLSFEWPES